MRILALLAFSLCAAAAFAQTYSWKDANGKVHYSDEPPPEKAQLRKVAPAPQPAGDPGAVRKSFVEKEMDARKKEKEAQEATSKSEKDKIDAEERRVNCEKARGNLKSIESGYTRFTTNAQGERVALEGATLDAELASARKAVDGWCK